MKKLHKKDWLNLSFIILGIIIFVISIYTLGYIYGSKTDWISQHFRLPEYLRNSFYKNKTFFPHFSFELGAGQNIYNLIYYGLFNPIILISYLLPFIPMKTFIIGINIILITLSTITIYKWINDKYNSQVALISTIIFITSACLIYHTHRHIMFVDYMLFLILALINVEKYFKEKKVLNLILSLFAIILISYYFSVGCLFATLIYGIYNYLIYIKEINIKTFFKEGIKFALILLVPVLLSSFILLPVMYTLLSGRIETNASLNLVNILIPTINPKIFLYDSYSVGLTLIIVYSLIDNLFSKKKENIFLAVCLIILFVFPIFNILLNGGMYISGKSLIPFLPLCILLIAKTINNILNKKISTKSLIIFIGISILTILININYNKLGYIIIDAALLSLTLIVYKYKFKTILIFIPYITLSIMFCLITNYSDKLVSIKEYKNIENKNINIESLYDDRIYRTVNLNNILENSNNKLNGNYYTTSFYASTSNSEYLKFVRNTFKNEIYNKDYHTITNSSNIIFNMYMANKYLISDTDLKGYDLKIKDNTNAYINNDVFSIGYTNNKLMSLHEFENLNYPYTIDALMNYTIIDKNINNVYESKIEEFNNNIEVTYKDFDYTINNNHYVFYIKDTGKINLRLDTPTNSILILSFKMNFKEKCSISNPSITINGITNTLSCNSWKYYNHNETFHYVISQNEPLEELNIDIAKGHYDISDIKIYEYNYDNLKSIKKNHDEFIITNINDKYLEGTINVTNDGYFQISIPYDKGFKILADNKEVPYEKVDTAFIGFKLNNGNHKIKIEYIPPLSKAGNRISIITLLSAIIVAIIKYKHNKNSV